jgi:ribonuclease T2
MIFLVHSSELLYIQCKNTGKRDTNVCVHNSLNGVPPGRTYNIQTMRDALEKALGKRVKIDCRGGTLSEIVLYFYVKGASEYVLTDALVPGSCRGAVYYPKK